MCRSNTGGLVVALLMLLAAVIPAVAARPPYEKLLNGVTLKSTYLDVLAKRGVPHYIGPSVGGTDMVLPMIDPSEKEPDTKNSAPKSPPRRRNAPGSAAGMSGPAGNADAAPETRYLIWMYEGAGKTADPTAGWNTYVFFNMMGEVEAVVVILTDDTVQPPVRAESGITFGSRMTEIVKEDMYGWPQPFRKVGDFFFLQYPDKNIAFALDTKTRKVVQIAIGLPMVVEVVKEEPKGKDTSGTSNPPGTLPIDPGTSSKWQQMERRQQ